MATPTTIKQQSTKSGIKRNGGDGVGNGDGNSGGDIGRRRQHGNHGNGDSHGGDGCWFLGIANLIEVRKANRRIENVLCCICNGLDCILFRRIMDGGVSKFGPKKLNVAGLKFRQFFAVTYYRLIIQG